MLTAAQFFGFLAAAVAITVSPGPDNLMVLAVGMARGRKSGMAFGLGCALGCLSHTTLAVIGVSALVAASPVAFTVVKIGGGLYLAWMGVQALRSKVGVSTSGGAMPDASSPSVLFVRGIVANAINPKVILFFLSFLPQFVVATRGDVGWQMAALGITFTAQAAFLFGLLGYFAGFVGQWLNKKPGIGLWLDRLAGVIFIGLGARLVFWP